MAGPVLYHRDGEVEILLRFLEDGISEGKTRSAQG